MMDMEQQQALVAFSPPDGKLVCGVTDDALEMLVAEYEGLEATDSKSSKAVVAACSTVRKYRQAVEQRRKDLKSPALDWGKRVDAEARRVTGLLVQIEAPLKTSQSEYRERKEAEKRAREEAEQKRVAAIHLGIANLGRLADSAISGGDVGRMRSTVDELVALESSLRAKFAECSDIAEIARVSALDRLRQSIEAHEQREAERKRLEEERAKQAAESARLAAERQAMDAERERMRAEKEALEAERMRAEREALEADRSGDAGDTTPVCDLVEPVGSEPRPEVPGVPEVAEETTPVRLPPRGEEPGAPQLGLVECLVIDLDLVAVGSEMERKVLERARDMLKTQAARVADLERSVHLGYPDGAASGCPPEDGRRYRVFFASRMVRWEAGPDIWNSDGDSGAWYANNADCYLPEPTQRGEGGADG